MKSNFLKCFQQSDVFSFIATVVSLKDSGFICCDASGVWYTRLGGRVGSFFFAAAKFLAIFASSFRLLVILLLCDGTEDVDDDDTADDDDDDTVDDDDSDPYGQSDCNGKGGGSISPSSSKMPRLSVSELASSTKES